jgi:hypothetical protein
MTTVTQCQLSSFFLIRTVQAAAQITKSFRLYPTTFIL